MVFRGRMLVWMWEDAEQSSWHSASPGLFVWQKGPVLRIHPINLKSSNQSFPACQLTWTLHWCVLVSTRSAPRTWQKSLPGTPWLAWDCRNQFAYFCFLIFVFSRSFSVTLLNFASFILSLILFSLKACIPLHSSRLFMPLWLFICYCCALLLPFLIHCPGFSLPQDVLCPLLTVDNTWGHFN